ncbi:hypothetical protein JJV70_18100 [Streptomyces sp. JJ66]|uniref:hypothetical protein n=1 Tax=Streptomyces sp. JJ66 TaxID=2803843 RepID=UPI001C5889C2|nr:hypothetical protein [Streptomyces sp. JJ66]MBW1603981.1 hypothetical protein [Streptomyces sp. JJ66]
MEAITALIAVFGTLLGATVSYLFQRRITERARELDASHRLRQERLDACAAYASALHNYRRLVVHRWYAHNERPGVEEVSSLTREVFELRSTAVQAQYRLRLLTSDAALHGLADRALEAVTELHDLCLTRAGMDARRDTSREAIHAFLGAATATVATR